ncbi:hypothetical protein GC722_12305 [Auraticoccus sp. F435]|uniref:DUF4178 domain-containing protein n=1 Tax=Auraticoccus cholistanensis TaxID=2656650 RepID=A0A6A9UVT4_9ACTN|nr:hypothetical protein [Auraticoccus cholistanensis]MVA76798.1 hypothetical protein [Auraticoccus cholistanensis]
MARPKARMKLGRYLIGDPPWRSLPNGVAVYTERDPEDGRTYSWEEWELLGYEDLDFWVEYDHHSRQVSLYWPARSEPPVDPTRLRLHQQLDLTVDGTPRRWVVREVGAGTIAFLDGAFTYDITTGQQVAYAELSEVGGPHRAVVEKFDDRVIDTYAATTLDVKAQKHHFGRRVAPYDLRKLVVALLVLVVLGLGVLSSCLSPRDCTPRSGQTTTDCRTGYGGGGGGGVGK